VTDDAEWTVLRDRYPSDPSVFSLPFRQCLDVLRAGGARSVVIETRYIDLDYRGEYSAFYSRVFDSTPDSAHRLHFFRASLTTDQVYDLPTDCGYLGYLIIRPTPVSRIGRSLFNPPPDIAPFIRTLVKDRVNLFGQELIASGVPFMQQDAQLGRCAHVAAWVCHYTAHLRGDVGRRAISDFALSIDAGLGVSRPVPSSGLSGYQMLELLRVFDLPAIFYNVQQLPRTPAAPWAPPDPVGPPDPSKPHPGLWDTRIFRICCRYLNSGFPVLVVNRDHAFVICGYKREPQAAGQPDWITFFRQDDQRGPYLPATNVFDDRHAASNYTYSPWEALMVPLPRKLWLPPEPVEFKGGELLLNAIPTAIANSVPNANQLVQLLASQQLTLRTYAISSNRFKAETRGRLSSELALQYRAARFPRYIWVVEAIDRSLRAGGNPCVLGEAIFDATSSELAPLCLCWHVPSYAWIRHTDGTSHEIGCPTGPYLSGGVGPP
jgi:hypothetical protein